MPVKEIFRDVLGDDRLMFFEGVQITVALPGGDFKTDMEQLTETRIISGVSGIMPERRNILLRSPTIDRGRRWQPGFVDINDRRVRRA